MRPRNRGYRFIRALICFSVCALASPQSSTASDPSAAPASSHYVIGPGDVLAINVWKEPEASLQSVVVRPDGFISMPMVKEVEAAGLTPIELEKELSSKFAHFFREADISVIVKEVHSEKVYLIGAVKKEGPITVKAPLTVLQAVAEAGGLTDYAKRSKIYILRRENGKEVRLPFDYSAVIQGKRSEENIILRPGDTVVVPQ
ncbi:MAG TPA: polysaccharide biosynthesis/export family protein [Bryobacteraceae bacterium]|nr:polysaccharide biosynthesis/export family protein [Bryobacteraceae bacterium]